MRGGLCPPRFVCAVCAAAGRGWRCAAAANAPAYARTARARVAVRPQSRATNAATTPVRPEAAPSVAQAQAIMMVDRASSRRSPEAEGIPIKNPGGARRRAASKAWVVHAQGSAWRMVPGGTAVRRARQLTRAARVGRRVRCCERRLPMPEERRRTGRTKARESAGRSSRSVWRWIRAPSTRRQQAPKLAK
jgi:hypothetical protein